MVGVAEEMNPLAAEESDDPTDQRVVDTALAEQLRRYRARAVAGSAVSTPSGDHMFDTPDEYGVPLAERDPHAPSRPQPGPSVDERRLDELGPWVLREMMQRITRNVARHGWDQERRFPECMVLLHAEVSEALEAWRSHDFDEWVDEHGKPEGVASELADVLIRLLDDCAWLGIDLFAAYSRKMDFNETRPYRHGKRNL